MRVHNRFLVTAAAVASVGLMMVGVSNAGRRATGEDACKPQWFIPSLSFRIIRQTLVEADARYTSLWQSGTCRVDPRHPFSYRLSLVGYDGVTISVQPGSFSGDMNAGASAGGGATIALAKWCSHQPVHATLIGAGPGYAHSGKGYRLTLSPISIRCE